MCPVKRRQKQHATATIPTLYQLTLQPFNHCPPGMGVSTVSAARILRGQLEGGSGEETMLAMDTFPYVALSKVTTQSRWPCGTQFTSHPPKQPPNAPTFLMSSPPDKVSSMCPIFVAPVLQPAASCCYAATAFIGGRKAARLTCHPT